MNFENMSEEMKELINELRNSCHKGFKLSFNYGNEVSSSKDAVDAYIHSLYKQQKFMIDFTVPGTKLPTIPENIEYSVKNGGPYLFSHTHNDLYSYGHYNLNNTIYINCEKEDYIGSNFYLIELSTVQKLAKQQNMENTKKIIGYKLICPEFEKAAVIIGRGNSNLSTFNTNGIYKIDKILYCDKWIKTIDNLRDAEVLDKWFEPVYEEDRIMIDKYEILFFKGYTLIDGYTFSQQFWEAARIISTNTKAKIMIGCSQQFNVSLDTINKILNKLNQQ